jgi:hypothetical protein
LSSGKAAVGVLAEVDTAPAIADRLMELGSTPQAHQLVDGRVRAADG